MRAAGPAGRPDYVLFSIAVKAARHTIALLLTGLLLAAGWQALAKTYYAILHVHVNES